MDRSRFVSLTLLAFGLGCAAFILRGLARTFGSYDLAVAVSAPVLFAAVALLAGLSVRAALDVTGVRPLE
ncbi:hypothetical protein EXE53_21925 [Halorubrum sp. SD626R]|uniref:hypothetical protein n=1 Tax=Halorubrum TaxID=56688 RepID=UPI0010F8A107|nr:MULTISPECIES: hypothetical protein [Halorubrum]TKX78300.1 hypothetical protein EXE53_21925 [Halorubrum sp. SD626R]